MEEEQLIKGCINGESWARKMVYEKYAPSMMSVCQRYVCNREIARDLLHDGFIKLFTKIDTYSGAGSFNGWMRRVFATIALEYLRRNKMIQYGVNEEAEYKIENIDISPFEHLSVNDLYFLIANLPDGCRTVFNMYAIEGYSHMEIAKELGISENTSRSQYFRARQMLQKMVMGASR